MAKTQGERLEEIEKGMEALRNQQRIIINQHDKILEFVDAIYTGMAQEAQEAPPAPSTGVTAQDAMDMLKDLTKDAGEGEQSRPRASTSWGRNDAE